MLATATLTATMANSQNQSERLQLANQFFREFRAMCFWHSPRDLVITEDLIPFVVKGLRTHGGRRGFILAGQLQHSKTALPTCEGELPECRLPPCAGCNPPREEGL